MAELGPPRLADLERLPGRDGLGLAFQAQWLELAVGDHVSAEALRALTDEDSPDRRCRLEPRGDVHGVAQDRVALADAPGQHLAGVDPHPQREPQAELLGKRAVQLAHRRLHREGGPDGTVRIVLVRDRRAEHRHHVVADVLVDAAAVPLDLRAQAGQAALDDRLDRLVVELLGDRREARDVGEHDGHGASLLGVRGIRSLSVRRCVLAERGSARVAEVRCRRRLGAASRAGPCQGRAARHAEGGPVRVLGVAVRAVHRPPKDASWRRDQRAAGAAPPGAWSRRVLLSGRRLRGRWDGGSGYLMCMPEIARAITSCWISAVPSKMS